jgi:hypothetical protein
MKPNTIIASIFLILLVIGTVVYYIIRGTLDKNPDDRVVACTMDAKICPDGSSVGRIGPDCEFEKCPTPTVQGTTTVDVTIQTAPLIDPKYPADIYK